jgi:glutathione peroxidase
MSLYQFKVKRINGQETSLEEYRGQVLLIVNTASACGFTPQYKGLEELYKKYKHQNFLVLGFPCNQFGQQEQGSEREILDFCEVNFGVTFPLFSKVDVKGPQAHPLFEHLVREKPGLGGIIGLKDIKWNFTKFLVDRSGLVVKRYAPTVKPAAIASDIEELLRKT